jgi:predicted AlkP superfamily pyrophosphatase or phosphodiesterase
MRGESGMIFGGALAALIAAAAVGIAAPASHARPSAAAPRVILISIDGLASDYLTHADELHLAIPNLRQLEATGTTAAFAASVLPSVTFPAHTTMLTGVNPARHGVVSNRVLDPGDPSDRNGEGGAVFYSQIKARTLFDAARDRGLRSAAVWWPVTVGAPVDDNFPDYAVDSLRDARLLLQLSSPAARDLVPAPAALLGAGDDIALDALRERLAVAFLRRQPRLLAVHYIGLDSASHAAGPYGPAAIAALEAIDQDIGALLAEVKALGLEASTTVVVTSDHGFLPVTQAIRIGSLFAAQGLLTVGDDGRLDSWQAFPWVEGGIAAIYVQPHAAPDTLARVDRTLDALRAGAAGPGIHRVYRGAELAAFEGYPGAYAAVDVEPGFTFSGELSGAVLAPTSLRGTHGHAPDRPELRACLLLRGPGIRPGARIPGVRLLDVAPTVAHVLGLDLGPAVEGRVLTEAFLPAAATDHNRPATIGR